MKCARCGRQSRPHLTLCAVCADTINARRRDEHRDRLVDGICVECGKAPPRDGLRTCLECAGMHARTTRRTYQARKQAGLCVECGDVAIPDMTKCAGCRDLHNTRRRAGCVLVVARRTGRTRER